MSTLIVFLLLKIIRFFSKLFLFILTIGLIFRVINIINGIQAVTFDGFFIAVFLWGYVSLRIFWWADKKIEDIAGWCIKKLCLWTCRKQHWQIQGSTSLHLVFLFAYGHLESEEAIDKDNDITILEAIFWHGTCSIRVDKGR